MTDDSHTTAAATKVLDVLDALCGFAVTGVSNKALADQLKLSNPTITRAMQTLVAKGWARKNDETGMFHPTAAFSRLTFKVAADFDRAQQRLGDMQRNYTSA